MKMSPLQVKHYHFIALSVTSRSEINIQETQLVSELYPAIDSEKLHTDVSIAEPDGDDDPHQFAVLLDIKYAPEVASNFPYSFSASLEGVFLIEHDGDIEERRQLVICNGAAILYGAAREQLLAITSRHRYGPMMLPSANFRNMVPSGKKKPIKVAAKSRLKSKKSKEIS